MNQSEIESLLAGGGAAKTGDFRTTYYAIRDRLWLVVLVFLLCAGAATIYVLKAPQMFSGQTVFMVDEEAAKVVKFEDVDSKNLRSPDLLNTAVQSIQGKLVLTRVIQKLNLSKDPVFLKGMDVTELSPEKTYLKLYKMLKVTLRRNTRLVDVVVTHRDAEMARKIADAIAHEFLSVQFEQRTADTMLANEFLVEEANKLKDKLEQSEQASAKYIAEHGVSVNDLQNTTLQNLKDLNLKLQSARGDRMKLESDLAVAKSMIGKPKELAKLPSISMNLEVQGLNKELADAESSFAVIKQRYKSKHPKYIAAEAAVTNITEERDRAVEKIAGLLEANYRAVKQTEDEFATAVEKQEKQAVDLNQTSIQYNVLQRDVESNKLMYQAVLGRLKETKLLGRLDQSPIRIVEPAYTFGPVSPKVPLILAIGIIGGLFAGLGAAYAISMLDTTLKTVDQAEQELGLPILAAVPQIKSVALGGSETLPVIREPHGPIAEAFRTLRSGLALLGREENRRVFLFTSALPSEGKSFTCANYAVVSAQAGVSTLLIDADLRRPAISPIFFKSKKTPGLSEYLAGQVSLEDAIWPSDIHGLSVLPAGSIAPNPAELLSSSEFHTLVRDALLKYDRVVVDTAPINAVSDTLLIASCAETICMVLRAAATPKQAVHRAVKALAAIKARPSGVVLNCVPARHGAGYYYHYAVGEYGTEGVYNTKPA